MEQLTKQSRQFVEQFDSLHLPEQLSSHVKGLVKEMHTELVSSRGKNALYDCDRIASQMQQGEGSSSFNFSLGLEGGLCGLNNSKVYIDEGVADRDDLLPGL
eukprot:TRINITY_DN83930_c0_g1_i1.p1 TRINITY_DN83930_c0_g1~~TRINITY_DN83930_c0_g1_i1.p1  ORF type:complete len:109 (+),score=9.25 TRINITY_DN83930_c0_g1_i1:24-329(+)